MSEGSQRADQEAQRLARQRQEEAAARLRARDITEQLSAREAERARKATTGQPAPRLSWRSVVITVLVLVVVVLLAYAGARVLGVGF